MKISKKNLMAFVKNHAYGEEVLGKGTIRSQTINSVINPSDCKTLVTMKYGIITETFILYK